MFLLFGSKFGMWGDTIFFFLGGETSCLHFAMVSVVCALDYAAALGGAEHWEGISFFLPGELVDRLKTP